VDATNLKLTFAPSVDSYVVLSGNVDLWTAKAGYNQDVGLALSGGVYPTTANQPEAWKESGGFAGILSPNAAYVQTVLPVKGGQSYTTTLVWKTNKSDPYTIAAGAGPVGAGFSPTRLTAQLIPVSTTSVFTKVSTQQYHLTGSDGSTWVDMDAGGGLSLAFPGPPDGGFLLISGNADLWTSSAGYNQDIGISVTSSNGLYPTVPGRPEAWKESGGFAGTFSPNAAFVQSALVAGPSFTYTAKLQWKANKPDAGTIYSGAGPIGGKFSPTSLTVILVPDSTAVQQHFSDTIQFSQNDSDGAYWRQVAGDLATTFSTGAASSTLVTVNADLWTSIAGYNQDIGIWMSGGVYGAGTLVAWKESGGSAGTFSPNAAFLSTVIRVEPGTYYLWVVWKANRVAQEPSAIYIAAGGASTGFSTTSLTLIHLSP
jgi:hypothetical protein